MDQRRGDEGPIFFISAKIFCPVWLLRLVRWRQMGCADFHTGSLMGAVLQMPIIPKVIPDMSFPQSMRFSVRLFMGLLLSATLSYDSSLFAKAEETNTRPSDPRCEYGSDTGSHREGAPLQLTLKA